MRTKVDATRKWLGQWHRDLQYCQKDIPDSSPLKCIVLNAVADDMIILRPNLGIDNFLKACPDEETNETEATLENVAKTLARWRQELRTCRDTIHSQKIGNSASLISADCKSESPPEPYNDLF